MNPIFKRVISGPVALSALIFTGCASTATNPAYNTGTDRVQDHFYAGIGFGQSRKDPDQNTTSFDVNDRVNGSGQLTVGMDLSRQVALELHTTDLGSAGFEGGGEIDYNVHGGSVLMYAGKNRHNFKRRGFTGFARAGVGYLQNSSDSIPFEKVNQAHFLVGAGLEYMFSSGFGMRLEGISFDEDAQYGQLGFVYRTGSRPERRVIQQVEAPAPVPTPEPAVEPAPIVAAAVIEEPEACTPYSGDLNGVNFESNSTSLTPGSVDILNSVATELIDCPVQKITITAHTDSMGSEEYNQSLSEQRAHYVVDYFASRGIERHSMQALAFGEIKPIDSNDTAEGRSRNRRVEILIEN